MSKYFSATNCSFYDSDIISEASMPADKVLVSQADYEALMTAQASGDVIYADQSGNPAHRAQGCGTCTSITHETKQAANDTLAHVKLASSLEDTGAINVPTASQVKAAIDLTYTKEEVDEALEEKADNATTLAGYGIADAYTKREIDGNADVIAPAIPGDLTTILNQAYQDLKAYEEASGEALPQEFYDELVKAAQAYADDATPKNWNAIGGTNPYKTTPPTKPVIDFAVTTAAAGTYTDGYVFTTSLNKIVYLPKSNIVSYAFRSNTNINFPIILPRAEYLTATFSGCSSLEKVAFFGTPKVMVDTFYGCTNFTTLNTTLDNLQNCTNCFFHTKISEWNINLPRLAYAYKMFYCARFLETFTASLPALTSGVEMFNGASALAQFNSSLPALSSGSNMFKNTALPVSEAVKIINSLPTYTSGTHVIGFTGSPCCSDTTVYPDLGNKTFADWCATKSTEIGWTIAL